MPFSAAADIITPLFSTLRHHCVAFDQDQPFRGKCGHQEWQRRWGPEVTGKLCRKMSIVGFALSALPVE